LGTGEVAMSSDSYRAIDKGRARKNAWLGFSHTIWAHMQAVRHVQGTENTGVIFGNDAVPSAK
jgi:hypothetical protein